MVSVHLELIPDFKPGDPRPDGYMQWYAWACVQHAAGDRQRLCPVCRLWHFGCENHTCEVVR